MSDTSALIRAGANRSEARMRRVDIDAYDGKTATVSIDGTVVTGVRLLPGTTVIPGQTGHVALVDADEAVIISGAPSGGGISEGGASPNYVNVADYGIIGDDFTDHAAAIQELLDTQPAGTVLFFPAGTYLISTGLVIRREWTQIVGAGHSSLIKLMPTEAPVDMIKSVGLWRLGFRNIAIDANAAANPKETAWTTCLHITGGGGHLLSDVRITGGNIEGLYMYDADGATLSNIDSSRNGAFREDASGIHLDTCQNVVAANLILRNNGFHGIMLSTSHRISLANVDATGNGWNGIMLATSSHDVLVANARVESNFRGAYVRDWSDSATFTNLVGLSNATAALVIHDGTNILLDGLIARDNHEHAIHLLGEWDSLKAGGLSHRDNVQGWLRIDHPTAAFVNTDVEVVNNVTSDSTTAAPSVGAVKLAIADLDGRLDLLQGAKNFCGYFDASTMQVEWLSAWGRRVGGPYGPTYVNGALTPFKLPVVTALMDGDYFIVTNSGADGQAVGDEATNVWGQRRDDGGRPPKLVWSEAANGALLSWLGYPDLQTVILRTGDWLVPTPSTQAGRALVDDSWGLLPYSARVVDADMVRYVPPKPVAGEPPGILDSLEDPPTNVQDAIDALSAHHYQYTSPDTPVLRGSSAYINGGPNVLPPVTGLREGTMLAVGVQRPTNGIIHLSTAFAIPVGTGWTLMPTDTVQFEVETYGVLTIDASFPQILQSGTSGTSLLQVRVYNDETDAQATDAMGGWGYFRTEANSDCTGRATWLGALNPGVYRIDFWGYRAAAITSCSVNRIMVRYRFDPSELFPGTLT